MSERDSTLVTILDNLGHPPQNVDIETYAIAETDPVILRRAAREVTPTYEELVHYKNTDTDLFRFITEEPQPEMSLGSGIMLRQQELSKTRRTAITLLSALAMSSIFGTFGYKSNESIQEKLVSDYPAYIADENGPERSALIFGGLGVLLGGMVSSLSGLSMSHRLARTPARKIVEKAEQNSSH